MKIKLKNTLRFLKPKTKPELNEKEFFQIIGEYFWDRATNNSKNSDYLLTRLQTLVEQNENQTLEEALQIIEDFRYFEAKVKGWK